MGDDTDTETEPGMYAVTNAGLTVGCGNFKAIDGGVLLFEDAERERVSGFVPHAELKYVLSADATTRAGESVWDEAESGDGPEGGSPSGDDEFRSELTVLGGLGGTYAERLHEDDIDSLSAMRRADAARVATAAGVSESRANRWIDAANRRDEGETSERQADAEASTEGEETDDA